MLDFQKLKTPPGHGDALIFPEPQECARWLRDNADSMSTAMIPFAGRTLAAWRDETRRKLIGDSNRPLVVIGHQPEFFHPGVWAKHVVARRLADALGGVALNLVVDNDTPRTTALAVPTVEEGRVRLQKIPVLNLPGRRIYEELPQIDAAEFAAIESIVRRAMGHRFDSSLMPDFLAALGADGCPDGVSQLVAARSAVDRSFGVEPLDRRVSAIPWSPLLVEILVSARRFAECYNAALASYRSEHRVRGKQRPIPDLYISAETIELPAWVVQAGRTRARLFVQMQGKRVSLYAEAEPIGEVKLDDWPAWESRVGPMAGGEGWRLRPRALTLTIWARLLAADLFIHGIGGAKYDRISDRIIRDFFNIVPPPFACVSATLRLDLPTRDVTKNSIAALRQEIRDWTWNPQRHLSALPGLGEVLREREAAVALQTTLRERRASRVDRRRTFDAIRRSTRSILDRAPNPFPALEDHLNRALRELDQDRIATDREYFFALHSRSALERLATTLPATADFRV